jgi:hypothetical protein
VVIKWVGQVSDLPKEDIVLIGAGGVFALSTDPAHPPTADGRLLRRLREEVTDPALAEKLDGRSFTATLTIDCAHFNSSLTEAKVYRGVNLKGGLGKPITAAQWLSASSIYLYDLTGPICEKSGKSTPPPPAPPPSEAAPAETGPATAALSEPAVRPTEALPPAPKPIPPVKAVKPRPKPVPAVAAPPAPVGEPGVWVQAGAYANNAIARAKFEALVAAVAPTPLVGPKLEPVPGQPLVRLLIGPYPSKSLAAQTCAALKRQKTDCFVRP